MSQTRWGILATGKIAHQFAADLMQTPDARLVAVGSRTLESAELFAGSYAEGGPVTPHGTYADLVADPDVDVVYIASPHTMHLEHARMAFEAGKHVLCEKPLTINLADASEMVALADRHDRFLMEAMWTACHPTVRALRSRLAAGEFGTPRLLHAELGFVAGESAPTRLVDPTLGASALLDMGIYPLTFAHLLFGEAESLTASADVVDAEGGSWDRDIAMTGRYAGGVLATMSASVTSFSSRAAAIATDLGRIDLADFHHPTSAVFTRFAAGSSNDESGVAEVVEIRGDEPVIGRGYGNEALEVGRCLAAGLRESPLVPHAQTLTLLRQMDELRQQVGVRLPGDA
jgi:predicted dehydrogenase